MFRPLLSDLPVTSFYAKKATCVLYQGNTDNSSVSTSGNGCIALVNKVLDNGNKDLESESSKCSFRHDQVKVEEIKKTELENQVKYVVREEPKNQDSLYISAQTNQCSLDDIIVQSSLGDGKPKMVGTSQGGFRSKFQSKESCACCKDSDNCQNCIAKENFSVQDVLGNVHLEGKAKSCSRLVDSLKFSINEKYNLSHQKAYTQYKFDSPRNVLYLTSSCKGLNNDEVASSSKLNDMDTQKFECHVLSQVKISKPHLEDLAHKSNVQVTFGILTTPRDHHSLSIVNCTNDPPRLSFLSCGKQLKRFLTIYQAIQCQAIADEDDDERYTGLDNALGEGRRLWDEIYTITYKRVEYQHRKPVNALKKRKPLLKGSSHTE